VSQPGFTQTTLGVLTSNANGAPLPYTLSTPFASTTVREPVGSSLGRQTGLGGGITFFNQNPQVSKQARLQIGFQHELPGGLVAEAVYVGNYGYDIEITRNINALPNTYLNTDNSRTAAMNNNNSFLTAQVPNPFVGLIKFRGTGLINTNITRSQLLRPFPAFGDITTSNNDGKSWYHSGQFRVEKRFSQGYTVQGSYTWSKWIQATEYLNAADPEPTRMISDQDATHRISMSAMYSLPFGRGRAFLTDAGWLANALVGGWQLQGVTQLQSGFPVVFGNDAFYNGGEISIPSDERNTNQWFNTSAFTSVLNASSTNATPVNHLRTLPFRFDSVRRDYIKNVDLSLLKDIQIREQMRVQLRLEFINAFNEPYFLGPVVNPTATNFGQISAANQENYARRAQIGVKFLF